MVVVLGGVALIVHAACSFFPVGSGEMRFVGRHVNALMQGGGRGRGALLSLKVAIDGRTPPRRTSSLEPEQSN